jgi:hypothetical protein
LPSAAAATLTTAAKHLAKEIAHVAASIETESALTPWPTAAKTHRARSTHFVVFFAFFLIA